MAYKPSQRRSIEIEPTEPNLTPIMNLMVVLIPLLLSSAEYVKLGAIELNLPPVAGPLTQPDVLPFEGMKNFELSVFIMEDELVVRSDEKGVLDKIYLNGDRRKALKQLQRRLYDIKKQIPVYYKNTNSITLQASAGIKYQVIIDVIDAVRLYDDQNTPIELFPDVRLSAGIL